MSGHIKRALLHASVPHDARAHRVEALLRLADALGHSARRRRGLSAGARSAGLRHRTAILPSCMPRRCFITSVGRWTAGANWPPRSRRVALLSVASGGPAASERAYLDAVWDGADVIRRDGELSWGALAGVIAKHVSSSGRIRRPRISPRRPAVERWHCSGQPIHACGGRGPSTACRSRGRRPGTIQRRGNVWLIQHAFPCTPCQLEGCERRLDSYSACLDALSPAQVMSAVDQALEMGRAA